MISLAKVRKWEAPKHCDSQEADMSESTHVFQNQPASLSFTIFAKIFDDLTIFASFICTQRQVKQL